MTDDADRVLRDQPGGLPACAYLPDTVELNFGESVVTDDRVLRDPDDVEAMVQAALKERIDRSRTPEFMDRLADRIEKDAPLLARLIDEPCQAETLAYLGFDEPTKIRCALIDNHRGPHWYGIEWSHD